MDGEEEGYPEYEETEEADTEEDDKEGDDEEFGGGEEM